MIHRTFLPILFLFGSFTGSASGYSRLRAVGCPGEPYLRWEKHNYPPNAGVFINANCQNPMAPGVSERDAVVRAMTTWNEADFDFFFYDKGLTDHMPFHSGDDPNNTDEMNVVGWYPGSLGWGVIARTWVIYECWGEIVEADIEFSGIESWSSFEEGSRPEGVFDIETVALHEFGHFIGLGHSTAPAVMQPYINPWDTRRELQADDKAGALAIYGHRTSFSGVKDYAVYE